MAIETQQRPVSLHAHLLPPGAGGAELDGQTPAESASELRVKGLNLPPKW